MSVCIVSVASAVNYDIVVDGIGYNITDRTNRTVTVAGWDESSFTSSTSPTNPHVGTGTGDVSGPVNMVLPWRVYYNGLYYKVTAISEDAFSDCSTLEKVTIPNTVTSIGEYAFQDCSNLQIVTVQWTKPLAIDANVFDGVNLSAARLRVLQGYKDTYAEANVWKDFGDITDDYADVDILMVFEDDAVKQICVDNWDGNNDGELSYREAMAVEDVSGAFVGNTQIKRFNEFRSFKGVTELGQNAFKGCTSLETIMLPSDLKTIKKEAFYGCEALSSVTFQTKVTTIGDRAFYGCANIEKLEFPTGLLSIGAHAFDGCAKVPSVTLYKKLNTIGEGAFANMTSCTSFSVSGTSTTFKNVGASLYTKDGKTIITYPAGLTTKSFTLPNAVTKIAPYAFAGAANVTTVNLNKTQEIGDYAFDGCSSLSSVTFTENVISVGDGAYRNCQNLYTVIIPQNVGAIGDNAFQGVASGIRVQVSWNTPLAISNGTFSTFNPVVDGGINGRLFVPIGTKNAYKNANGWKWFDFVEEGTIAEYATQIIQFADDKVREICVANFDADHDGYVTYDEAGAVSSIGTLFKGAQITKFDELQYFTSLSTIQSEAFANSTLSSIVLPLSVTSIGANAFAYCNNLKTFNVPASVTSIGNGVLKSCASLTTITVDADNTNYVSGLGSLFTKDHSTLIQFPAYNTYTNIMVPDGVKTIAPEAFLGASRLTTVSIYKSVQTIGQNAFGNCSALKTVKVYWSTPLSVPANTFSGVDVANATLNVPVGTEEAYENANVWKDFGTTAAFTDEYSDIIFADAKVEAICVENWDTNKDGKINGSEAKAVTNLGTAFSGNTEITSFNELKNFTGLTDIPANAFKGCSALTAITLPTTIKNIGESAFEGCEVLSTTSLPTAVVNIGKKAFYGCNAITQFYLLKNVASVGEGAFAHCASLGKFVVNSANTAYKAIDGILFNIDNNMVIAYPAGKNAGAMNANDIITEIYPYAFSGVTKMTSFNFNKIEKIGGYAFEDCTGLSAIDIGTNVTTIGEGAFSGCKNLQSINIPTNVTSIGQKAFNGMPAAVRCQVAWNTPLAINNNTFSNYEPLSGGQISGILFGPKGKQSSYENAPGWNFFTLYKEGSMEDYEATIIHFADPLVESLAVGAWDADGDNRISYEEASLVADLGTTFTGKPITTFNELQYFTALTEIGDNAFKNTTLSAITMPESITRFGKSSFQGTAISTFNRLPGLTEIGDSAFAYNTGFTKVQISSNIVTVGTGAFKGCPKLTTFKVVDNANYSDIDGVLYNKAGDALLQFPAAKTINGEYILSENVKTIAEDAFTMVKQLTILNLHDGVTSIGANAFRACEGLDSVVVAWRTPLAVPANTFSGVDVANCALSVPKGTISQYKANNVWKQFRIDEYLDDTSTIDFADAKVKAICVENWDANHDGELTVAEAKQASILGTLFKGTDITSFKELKYFTGLTSIGTEAFKGCTALTEIELPKTIRIIQKNAFADCSSLQGFQIPAATATLGQGILANCSSLTGISVAKDNTTFTAVDGVVYNMAKTVLWIYPAGKQGDYEVLENTITVKSYAFSGAEGLTSVRLPKGMKTLEQYSFNKCSSLEFINLPSSIMEVQEFSFSGCSSLKTMKVAWKTPIDVDAQVFDGFNFSNTRLYVPLGSKDGDGGYAESVSWGQFATIIEYPNCDVNNDGKADMLDAVDIVKFTVGQNVASFDKYLADFDDDDEVTVADAVILVGKIADGVAAPNIVTAPRMGEVEETVTITKDMNNVISLCIESEVPYTAFQFDLTLPEASEVQIAKLTERLKGHQLVYNKIGENTYRFAAISFVNKAFDNDEGSVINILAGNPDLDEIVAENIRFVTADGSVQRFDNITSAIPTAITELMGEVKAMEDGVYYNLSGMRVDHPTKGVYILNGKKVVIK